MGRACVCVGVGMCVGVCVCGCVCVGGGVLVCFRKWCVKVNMSVGMRVLLRVCGDVCCQCVHSCVLTRFNVYFTNCVNEPTPKHFPCFIVNIFTIDKWH